MSGPSIHEDTASSIENRPTVMAMAIVMNNTSLLLCGRTQQIHTSTTTAANENDGISVTGYRFSRGIGIFFQEWVNTVVFY